MIPKKKQEIPMQSTVVQPTIRSSYYTVYSPITTRGTLADRFILRGTKVVPLCRLLPTCYFKYFRNEFTKLKTCFSTEHVPERGENTSAEE